MAKSRKRRLKHKTTAPPLSLCEIRFCQLYLQYDNNATRAYIGAGFTPQPATDQAAAVRAWRVLRRRNVRAYIQDLRDAACEAAKVTTEDLARGFSRGANADVTAICGPEGEALPPGEWPKELKSAVTSIEIEEVYETRTVRGKRKKVKIGLRWKVKVENKTECRKVLAQWKKMIGADKDAGPAGHAPLVVGGDGNPGNL